MTPERFQEILDAYGGDANRWPAGERAAAEALAARSPAAQRARAAAQRLDRLLDRLPIPDAPPIDAPLLTARVLAAAQTAPADSGIAAILRAAGLRGPAVAGLGLAAAIAGFAVGWDMSAVDPATDEFSGLLPAPIMEVDPSW
jgi:hypothetical protein